MKGFAVFDLFAYAFIFLIWAYHMVSLSGMPSYEDFLANKAVLIPFVEEAASRYVSDCLAYAWVQALDNNTIHYTRQEIQTFDVQDWFDSCWATAKARLVSAVPELVDVSTVPPNPVVHSNAEKNVWWIQFNVDLNFAFPFSRFGFLNDISKKYIVHVDKNMVISDTGIVWTGGDTDPSNDRNVYLVTVWNKKTGIVEVNGVWPK